jgi:hypothetical protein
MKRFLFGFLSLMLGIGFIAAPETPAYSQDTGTEIYKKCLNSTVWVLNVFKDGGYAMGSGSIVDRKQKLIVTNYHVVTESPTVLIMFPEYDNAKELITEKDKYKAKLRTGAGYRGKVLFAEKRRDLALVQIEDPRPLPKYVKQVELQDKGPTPGERIYSIGSPGASENLWIYTPGDCRQVGVKKYLTGGGDGSFFEIEAKVIESTSPTNQGDSGGPLFNGKGQQIGVTQGGNTKVNSFALFIHASEILAMCKERKIKLSSVAEAEAEVATDSKEPDTKSLATKDLKETQKTEPKTVTKEEAKDKTLPKAGTGTVDPKAAAALKLAKDLFDLGKRETAINRAKKVVIDFPNSTSADEARKLLKEWEK